MAKFAGLAAILCVLGVVLSAYALYVEHKKNMDPTYEALCDFGGFFSCSKVFTSKYGSIASIVFGEEHPLSKPNAFYGLFTYGGLFLLYMPFLPFARLRRQLAFYIIAFTCVSSVYLAYVLAFILKDFCVVCVSMYVINAALLINSILGAPKRSTKRKPN